jgi:hypothetical protein
MAWQCCWLALQTPVCSLRAAAVQVLTLVVAAAPSFDKRPDSFHCNCHFAVGSHAAAVQVLTLVVAAAPSFDERAVSNCLHGLAVLELAQEREVIAALLGAAEGLGELQAV